MMKKMSKIMQVSLHKMKEATSQVIVILKYMSRGLEQIEINRWHLNSIQP